jgi:MYXO-CTERM domain-containing protein
MPVAPTMPKPEPGSLGSVCGGPADCASKVCVAYNGAQVCSQACDAAKACPGGFDCLSGFCFQHIDDPTTDPPVDPAADPGNGDAPTASKNGCSASAGAADPLAALLIAGAGMLLSRRRARPTRR